MSQKGEYKMDKRVLKLADCTVSSHEVHCVVGNFARSDTSSRNWSSRKEAIEHFLELLGEHLDPDNDSLLVIAEILL